MKEHGWDLESKRTHLWQFHHWLHWLAVWSLIICLTSLHLSVLIYEVEIITLILPSSISIIRITCMNKCYINENSIPGVINILGLIPLRIWKIHAFPHIFQTHPKALVNILKTLISLTAGSRVGRKWFETFAPQVKNLWSRQEYDDIRSLNKLNSNFVTGPAGHWWIRQTKVLP